MLTNDWPNPMRADVQFKEFVERQRNAAAVNSAIDWNKERDEWLCRLRQLYSLIAAYLDDYVKSGVIKLRESPIELNEENIGVYTANRLAVVIGGQEIDFIPVGTSLIGTKGRVDVKGSLANSRLVLIKKDITDPKQLFPRTSPITPPGNLLAGAQEQESASKETDWAWKIVSRPPAMQFIELNKDTFLEMLLALSNG